MLPSKTQNVGFAQGALNSTVKTAKPFRALLQDHLLGLYAFTTDSHVNCSRQATTLELIAGSAR